ncbi:MAG: hypothetical protein KGL50_15235 [Burkholderiales bacterium]|nr:hypothetical protein [Burkholderiales bacterium]
MTPSRAFLLNAFCGAACCAALSAQADPAGAPSPTPDDSDALSLQATPAPQAATPPWRAAFEIGVGRIDQRLPDARRSGRRASIDLRYAAPIDEAWRFSLSDRLDDVHPAPQGQRSTVNSLREAFVSWQPPGGASSLDLGRVNLRLGPAYGYNPTDYFRRDALRSITTADPVTLRELRLGTVMARASELWDGGGASLALAPKLQSAPDLRPASLDLGATNGSSRGLLTVNQRASDRLSGQASLLLERGQAATVGLSASALATDALVAYGEWASVKSTSLADRVLGVAGPARRFQQAALGLTYTLPSSLAVTLEAEYNGAGLDRDGWSRVLASGPAGYQRYLALTQPSQELGARQAWLVYLTQKGLGLKQLDLTAFVRTSAVDHSRLAWAELRYHWQRFDAALQWQRSDGGAASEYGLMPYRQVVQLVGVFFL